jgi:hypothetical protein
LYQFLTADPVYFILFPILSSAISLYILNSPAISYISNLNSKVNLDRIDKTTSITIKKLSEDEANKQKKKHTAMLLFKISIFAELPLHQWSEHLLYLMLSTSSTTINEATHFGNERLRELPNNLTEQDTGVSHLQRLHYQLPHHARQRVQWLHQTWLSNRVLTLKSL